MLSVSLNGNINILNSASPSNPHIIQANQVAITSMCFDQASETLYTGSFDGVVVATDILSGVSTKVKGTHKPNGNYYRGEIHHGKISGLTMCAGSLVSVGWDDSIRFSTGAQCTAAAPLVGQPCAVACSLGLIVVGTTAEIALYRGENKVFALASLSYAVTCIAVLGEEEIAVGGDDSKTHIYSIAGDSLVEVTTIETRSAVSAVSYSPVGDAIAIGDNGRQVEVYERGTWTARVKGRWVFHTSKITALAWSPSGNQLASGSLDESIIIWNCAQPTAKLQYPFAHSGGVSAIQWMADGKLVSAGNDHTIVFWNIPSEIA